MPMSHHPADRHTLSLRPRPLRRLGTVLGVSLLVSIGGTMTAAPALAEDCPTATIRAQDNSTELPECRAYEMVTPPYKEGFASVSETFTDDGSVAYTSTGTFAGSPTNPIFNQYVATRSPTGWLTSALNPPATTYRASTGNGADALSADLRSSLWIMHRADQPAEVFDYYLREHDGVLTRVGPGGVGLGTRPVTVATSSDLSHVVFGPYELVGTGNTAGRLVGVDNAGNPITPGETCPNAISPDGRVVTFMARCVNGPAELWVRINGTTTIEASASQCTRTAADPGGACNAPAGANFAGLATNGARVFFTTTQQLVNGDTDHTDDLYACDIPPGSPTPAGLANPCTSLSEVSGGATGANVENVVRISDDGSRVYFVAQGMLAGNLGTRDIGALQGANNLYMWQKDATHPAGQTKFIATLDADDIRAQTTSDGRYLLFTTATPLLASDTDETRDVYRYDSDTGALLRLSTGALGTGGNGAGFNAELGPTEQLTLNRPRSGMTSDGGTVVFETAEALSTADTDGSGDVYEWHNGQVSLISRGGAAQGWIDASGTDIYFTTNTQLTPDDTNTTLDIYDARVGGGFSFAQPSSCSDEACLGASALAPPAPGVSASAAFNGTGNLTSVPVSAGNPPPKRLTRAQKLATALRACNARHARKKRAACEKKARRTYRRSK